MNKRILELEVTRYDNEFVGYRDGLLPFLIEELQEYVSMLPTDNDCDFEHMNIVKRTSEVICMIQKHVQHDELISVYNVLCEDMDFCRIKITEVK